MLLGEFLEKEIIRYLDGKQTPLDKNTKQYRPEEFNIFYLQKDYATEVEKALKKHNLVDVKQLFDELKEINRKVSKNSPERDRATTMLKHVTMNIKAYIVHHPGSKTKLEDVFSSEFVNKLEAGTPVEKKISKTFITEPTRTISSTPFDVQTKSIEIHPQEVNIAGGNIAVEKELLSLIKEMKNEMRQAPVPQPLPMPQPLPSHHPEPLPREAPRPLPPRKPIQRIPAHLDKQPIREADTHLSSLTRERTALEQTSNLSQHELNQLLHRVEEESKESLSEELHHHMEQYELERARKEKIEHLQRKQQQEKRRLEEHQEQLALNNSIKKRLQLIEQNLHERRYAKAEQTIKEANIALIKLPHTMRASFRAPLASLEEQLRSLKRLTRDHDEPTNNKREDLYKLGLYYYYQGQYEQAIETFQSLLIEQPNNLAAKIRLAEAQKKMIA